MGCAVSKSAKDPTAGPITYYTPTPTTVLPTNNPSLGNPNLVSGGKQPTLLSMQQQVMQNPEFMSILMNSPATGLSRPDMISALKKMQEENQVMHTMGDSTSSPPVNNAATSLMNSLLSNPVILQTITEQYQHLQQINSQNPVDNSHP